MLPKKGFMSRMKKLDKFLLFNNIKRDITAIKKLATCRSNCFFFMIGVVFTIHIII